VRDPAVNKGCATAASVRQQLQMQVRGGCIVVATYWACYEHRCSLNLLGIQAYCISRLGHCRCEHGMELLHVLSTTLR
jgi:hypothetical protein